MRKISAFALCLLLTLISGCGSKNEDRLVSEEEDTSYLNSEIKTQSPETRIEQNPEIITGTDKDEKINPFLTKEEETMTGEAGNYIPLEGIGLSAILYSPSGSSAIINGRILKVGGIIDDMEVIEIQPEEVILTDTKKTLYIVKLKKLAGE